MIPFLSEAAVYRQFLGDRQDFTPDTRDYRLSGVLVREIYAADPENVDSGMTTLYFFDGQSSCTDDETGAETDFPRPKNGDCVILHPDTAAEQRLRVAEAAYYTGTRIGALVRLKLK